MDMKKKIDDFSATIASGLKDDPELMLDVKEEIKSHIEESCEHFRHDGKNDDESFDLALKNFLFTCKQNTVATFNSKNYNSLKLLFSLTVQQLEC